MAGKTKGRPPPREKDSVVPSTEAIKPARPTSVVQSQLSPTPRKPTVVDVAIAASRPAAKPHSLLNTMLALSNSANYGADTRKEVRGIISETKEISEMKRRNLKRAARRPPTPQIHGRANEAMIKILQRLDKRAKVA